jgi:hypothetical protein
MLVDMRSLLTLRTVTESLALAHLLSDRHVPEMRPGTVTVIRAPLSKSVTALDNVMLQLILLRSASAIYFHLGILVQCGQKRAGADCQRAAAQRHGRKMKTKSIPKNVNVLIIYLLQ